MPKTQSFPNNIISSIANALNPDTPPNEAVQEKHAIKLLMSQHREVEKLFSQIEELGDKAIETKAKLFSTLAEKFLMHCMIEERIFYPASIRIDKSLVLEAREEHDNAKAMVAKIQKLKATHETYNAKMKVLKELIQHHVKEEEKELFPEVEARLGEEKLIEIGKEMTKEMMKKNQRATKKPKRISTRKVSIRSKSATAKSKIVSKLKNKKRT